MQGWRIKKCRGCKSHKQSIVKPSVGLWRWQKSVIDFIHRVRRISQVKRISRNFLYSVLRAKKLINLGFLWNFIVFLLLTRLNYRGKSWDTQIFTNYFILEGKHRAIFAVESVCKCYRAKSLLFCFSSAGNRIFNKRINFDNATIFLQFPTLFSRNSCLYYHFFLVLFIINKYYIQIPWLNALKQILYIKLFPS